MTLSSTINRWDYVGNGTAGPFPFTSLVLDASHLKVYVGGVLKTMTIDYTVSGVGNPTGGTVVFTAGNYPQSGEAVLILRIVPIDQLTDYVNHDPFDMEVLERSFDKLTMIAQQLKENLNRAITLPESSKGSGNLPTDIIPNYALVGNQQGTGFTFASIEPEIPDLNAYALLSGRSGGQTLMGGSGASENLELVSTAHSTKGVVKIEDSFNFSVNPITFNAIGLSETSSYHCYVKNHDMSTSNREANMVVESKANSTGYVTKTNIQSAIEGLDWRPNSLIGIHSIVELNSNWVGSSASGLRIDINRYSVSGVVSAITVHGNSSHNVTYAFRCDMSGGVVFNTGLYLDDVNQGIVIKKPANYLASFISLIYANSERVSINYAGQFSTYHSIIVDRDSVSGWGDLLKLSSLGSLKLSVDGNGNLFHDGFLDVGGLDPNFGQMFKLRITRSYSEYVDGTGSQAPRSITGSNNPVFSGYLRWYIGTTRVYIPYYTSIQ